MRQDGESKSRKIHVKESKSEGRSSIQVRARVVGCEGKVQDVEIKYHHRYGERDERERRKKTSRQLIFEYENDRMR